MYQIDIESDIEQVIKEIGVFFESEIPFVTAITLNDTMFDVRRRIVGSTYQKAFDVRNTRFPGTNWRIDKIAVSSSRGGRRAAMPTMSQSLSAFRSGGVMMATLRQRSLNGGVREWTNLHVQGGTKVPRGGLIAIPKSPDVVRNKGGSVKARMKPIRITDKKDHFLKKDKAGRKKYIGRRTDDGKVEVVYTFAKRANIRKRFRFYEDAFDTVDRVMLRHWGYNMAKSVNRSRFTPT